MTLSVLHKYIAVIGGGPAGLMAAEKLAESGARVTIYDLMPSVGRKFLMAGRGGLNLTHSEPLDSFIVRYGEAADWLEPAIGAFTPDNLRAWAEGLGQSLFVGSSGRVFPVGLKASPLLRAWLRRLESLGVKFAPRHRWVGWRGEQLVFTDVSGGEVLVNADATVLALGGASWPRLGSDGAWADILRAESVDVSALRPANCGFIAPWSDIFAEKFEGIPLKPVVISFAGKTIQGEAMITARGIEGGAIYALSGPIRDAIETSGQATIMLDLRPGLSVDALAARLDAPRGSQSAATYLRKTAGLSPVSIGLMREALGGIGLPVEARALAGLIKATRVTLTATTGLDRAISSAGGIGRGEVDAHFMLRKKPGVYVIGEMLDWEAPTGGYLLQACFSTAVAAARGVKL